MSSETPTSTNAAPRRRWMLPGLLLILGVIGLIAFPGLRRRWETPLGPSLGLETSTPLALAAAELPRPTSSPALATAASRDPLAAPVSPTVPLPTDPPPTPTAAPHCGGPAQMLVLGIGADNGVGYQYGLSDVIRIARVDFVNPKITMLSLPRDLWIELPGIVASNGMTITNAKLNQAYFYGGPGMGYYDGPGAGPGLLARTLDFNFGLRVDHYGAVNMSTFERIVDAVGGIDVYLEKDVDGTPWDNRTADMGYFPAGQHHFTGNEALRFSRIRKRYGDFARQDNQTLVLCALRAKLLTPAVLTKIPKLVTAFQDSVQTDLTPEQIGQLACLLPKIERENVIFSSIPSEEFTIGRATGFLAEKETSVLRWEPDVIRDYVSRFVSGTWPTQPDEPSCP